MPASYPKPDGQKVTRHEPKFGWTDLCPDPGVKVPRLPTWRPWQTQTKRWWTVLWGKPQAAMWVSDGSTLWALACLYDDLIAGRADAARVSAEMRQHEDRHGLNPKAMLQLRWRVVGEEAVPSGDAAPTPIGDRRSRLKVV
jgi:hypothetical protein